jgi:hypothetical protein
MRFENALRLSIMASVLLVSCGNARKQRAVVAFPQEWSEGEYRNCYLNGPGHVAGFNPGPSRRDLPQLDCDRFVDGEIIHHTSKNQIFVLDVSFSGNYTLGDETTWTCQRTKDSLECRR